MGWLFLFLASRRALRSHGAGMQGILVLPAKGMLLLQVLFFNLDDFESNKF